MSQQTVAAKQPMPTTEASAPPHPGMVWVPGGTFTMGSEKHYPEEAPAHQVTVSGFWMDQYQVTNRDFERFVSATKYVTVAERTPNPKLYPGAPLDVLVPGSIMFRKAKTKVNLNNYFNWWQFVPGINWRKPQGSGTSARKLRKHPVVHLAYEDVAAYAQWAGKAIPTEAQWEFAARGGLEQAAYVWGDEFAPDGAMMANTWQGEFPWQNLKSDGFELTAPVGSYPPNGYGLYEMAGNVWEWTQDWFRSQHDKPTKSCCTPVNPRGATVEESVDPNQLESPIPRKVTKGGSFLCAPNYCLRYRPAARSPQTIDTSTCHIGFRCVVNVG